MAMAAVPAGAAARLAIAYARAVEARDAKGLATLYHDDCELVLINRNAPPSRPVILRGKPAVAAMWEEDCARDMAHRVEAVVADAQRLSWHLSYLYPDGTRVVAMGCAEIVDGLIRRETTVECWDE
jgi:ketosteroid isomerase-like protein